MSPHLVPRPLVIDDVLGLNRGLTLASSVGLHLGTGQIASRTRGTKHTMQGITSAKLRRENTHGYV